jgi:2-iminobutanoate/2-iminopropanoate deaminase
MKKYFIPSLAVAVAVFGIVALTAQTVNSPKTVVQTGKAPKAAGPLSQAIVAGGFVYCSGQLPVDPATGKVVSGGIEEQTRQVLNNLQAVLEAAGSSLDHVVKCNVLLADMADFPALNKVYAEFFKAQPPARLTFAAAGLALGVKVEIDCIAVKP